ncbi:YqiA/YcfP family alpha/beta fold hydrolase [Pleionea sp. CnH1-48]|uniref:YqiA/YcfP family alpha/beta fold hydrolase n=1 Tax=Pleionea sp. CnH1-48 TaxID=2954494 RepID=UPI002097E616|nr:YqiA/YcfP family alpha/beta fold hydrolase [Pleionea sp. CnH1-48]MCO7226756.1 dienelactone hydrolase family protein [Pleionea sp. CnH1-48]
MKFLDKVNITNNPALILAHGAGASSASDFMEEMYQLINKQGINTARFNFNYMQTQVDTGKKRPPEKMDKLIEQYQSIIEQHPAEHVWIGGKSMGGRVATLVAEHPKVRGVIVLGYPFHPVGKPDKLRTEHLGRFEKPLLIAQGERDTFGTKEEVSSYSLDTTIQFCWLPDGDHSLKPRKRSGIDYADNMNLAAQTIATFIQDHS